MTNWLSSATGGRRPGTVPLNRPSLTKRALAQPAIGLGFRDRFLAIGWDAFVRWAFFFIVVMPIGLTAVYEAVFASRTYVAEARFAVRQATDRPLNDTYIGAAGFDALPSPTAERDQTAKASTGNRGSDAAARASQIITSAIQSIAGGRNDLEPFMLVDYVSSLEMVRTLDQDRWLRARFAAGSPDWIHALPDDASQEQLEEYWRWAVAASLDTTTGLISLKVTAFTPEDAQQIADHIVAQCEAMLSRIVERSRHDRMAEAKGLLTRAQERYTAAEAALRKLRSDELLIDPALSATTLFKQLMELITARVALDVQMRLIEPNVSADAPQLKVLKARIAALDAEIEKAKATLTDAGGAPGAASNYLTAYETAESERIFAMSFYQAALDGVERVRLASEREAAYLAVFAPPLRPDGASGPNVTATVGTMALICLLLFGMLTVVAAASRDQMGG